MSNLTVGIPAAHNVSPVDSMWLSDRLQVQMQSYNMDQQSSQLACFPHSIVNHGMTKSYPSIELAGLCKPVSYNTTT